jgi:tetratricopeptide (TPR) repeat protein
VLTCWLVYLIGKELANRLVGLISCLVAALYGPFIFYSIVPLKTSLSVFLFALTCYLLVSVIGRTSMIKTVLLGIAIGLANNVRPNCLVLIPVIFLLIAWHVYRDRSSMKMAAATLILYLAGLGIVQAPFMIRNYQVAGETSATPSQSGFNLFMCNNLEYGYPVPFASTAPAEMGIHFTIEASRRVGKQLSSGEASQYWTREVIRTALEQPAAFTWRQVKKILFFLNRFEKGDHYHVGFLSDYIRFFKFPFIGFWLIMPFGMAGMSLKILRSRKAFALGAIFIIYAMTLAAFFTNTRVRLPLLVIIIPFAVMGLYAFRSYLKNRQLKKIAVYPVILCAFFIIEFFPIIDAKDMTAYLNTHAIILNSNGLKEEAVKYWEKSSILEKQYSDFANLSLAGRYHSERDFEKAFYYLDKIKDESYAAPNKYETIGNIMVNQGQLEKAATAYEKALEINSGLRTTRLKLIKVLWRIDKQRALEENDRLEYINSFYNLYGIKPEEEDGRESGSSNG